MSASDSRARTRHNIMQTMGCMSKAGYMAAPKSCVTPNYLSEVLLLTDKALLYGNMMLKGQAQMASSKGNVLITGQAERPR